MRRTTRLAGLAALVCALQGAPQAPVEQSQRPPQELVERLEEERYVAQESTSTVQTDTSLFSPTITRLDCGGCYWEASLLQHPVARKRGVVVGLNGTLITSIDEWRTTVYSNINTLTQQPALGYLGDTAHALLPDGRLLIAAMTNTRPQTGALWRSTAAPEFLIGPFEQQVLVPTDNAPLELPYVLDFPKVAVDATPTSAYFGTTYVSANAVWFPERHSWSTGVFTIRNGVVSKQFGPDIGVVQSPNSIIVTNGTVLLANREYGATHILRSTNGATSFTAHDIPNVDKMCLPRLISTSNQYWGLSPGPTLAADPKSTDVYVTWAAAQSCVPAPNFTNGTYGLDYDVYVSHSPDNGRTWNTPVQIPRLGDQGYPNITIDRNGDVYVGWIDHRNLNRKAFNVFVTRSMDHGASFGVPVRANDLIVPSGTGGRDPGDYLDMLGLSNDYVFVMHPCVGKSYDPLRPTDACVARIPKTQF